MRILEYGIALDDSIESGPPGLVVVASTDLPIYSGCETTLVDLRGGSLIERIQGAFRIDGAHRAADYFVEGDLLHCVRSCTYHLERLVGEYASLTRMFAGSDASTKAIRGNTSNFRVYYETESFLGGARRAYDHIGRVIWRHYEGRDCPSSISDVLKKPMHALPDAYRAELDDSWNEHGTTLRAYRDCVTHRIPLTNGGTTCWFERFGDRWGTKVPMPSNPIGGRREFDFAGGPDALSYCHSFMCHFTELIESTMSLERVRNHLAHPSTL